MQETMSQSDVQALLRGQHVRPRPAPQPQASIELELPIPPRATHPNARTHWGAKATATKRQRSDCSTMASIILRSRQAPRWAAASVLATFHVPGKSARTSDPDNLIAWLKATIDGLQDAGVFAND